MTVALWPAAMQGDVTAVTGLLRIMERRAKLLGLDAPVKTDAKVEGAFTGSVMVVPGIMERDAWQAAALAHQRQLEEAEASVRVTGGGSKTDGD